MSGSEREMLRAERAELGEFVATLTAAEWAAPSLCSGWTVRDVVVHVVGPPDLRLLVRSGPGFLTNLPRWIDRVNADRQAEFANLSVEQIRAAYDAPGRV